MAKSFKFGTPQKEQKSDDLGVNVTDIVNTYVDENLETIAQLSKEKTELEVNVNKYTNLAKELAIECEEKTEKIIQLEGELFTKNNSIQGYNETIEQLNVKIVELTERNIEIEEESQTQKKITVKVSPPKGFKPTIDDETIAEMREYAYSILPKKGTINFYEHIGIKFGVASGSAYTFCKDIYQGE